jgi:hypothetical protein
MGWRGDSPHRVPSLSLSAFTAVLTARGASPASKRFYPESVKTILVVNCPGIIPWLYSFVKPFIPEVLLLTTTVVIGS